MKKNTKKVWIVSLLAAGLSLLAVGCETAGGASSTETPKGPLSERLTGFEVAAQTTVEIGEYYVPVKPEAKIDGESAFVSVSAKRGTTDLFFNGDDALLIDSFEDVTLTYTVVEGEQSVEKSTVLKVQDTGKPFIVTNTLPDRIYRGDTFDCSRYIRFEDLSGTVASSTMTVTDQNGAPLTVENGKFTLPESSPVQTVTFTMSATDGTGNTADKTVSVPVMDYPLWTNPLDFAALDISKVTSQYAGTVVEEAEKDGQKVIKQSLKTPWVKATTWSCAHVTFPEGLSAYTYFDYIKVTVRAETNCDIQVYGASFENGDGASFKAGAAETKEIVYDMQSVKDGNTSVIRNDKLRFNIAVLAGRDYSALYGTQKYYYVTEADGAITVLDDKQKPVKCTATAIDGGYKLVFEVEGKEEVVTEYVRQTDKNGVEATDNTYYAYSTEPTAETQKPVYFDSLDGYPDIEMNFYVYDIEFGFYERNVANDAFIDLTGFGLTADEVVSAKFTPTGGTEKTVQIGTFLPQEDGRLELVVKKKGYRTTTVVLQLNSIEVPVVEGNENDNDGEWNW